MAKKSAERLSKPSSKANANAIVDEHNIEFRESASVLTNELKSTAKLKSGNLSIFADDSFERKVGGNGGNKNLDENANAGGIQDSSSSIKSRMKNSLARRRTALRSRNLNIQDDINLNGGDPNQSNLKKKSALAPAQDQNLDPVQQKVKSPMMMGELKSMVLSKVENECGEQMEQKSVSEEDKLSVEGSSLELDDTAESELVDSIQSSTSDVHEDPEADEVQDNYVSGNSEKLERRELDNVLDEQLAKFINTVRSPALETLKEEENEIDLSSENQHSQDIEMDNGELISVVESCESIKSKSSSHQQVDDEQLSPNNNAISEASSLSPADSIQTFSVGSSSLSYPKSAGQSRSSGVTPTDSIQTFSIGGRPINISTDPFQTSLFSPSPVRTDEVSLMDSESGNEADASPGGHTVVPDISIHNESQAFSSPNKFMIYASPNAKSSFDDLSRQLEAIRSEQKESDSKMNARRVHGKDLLQMYERVHVEVESKASPISKALATGDSCGLSKAAAASLIERNKTLVKEVRFADQTCVELSERNFSLLRQLEKMEKNEIELKSKNDSLHDSIIKASQDSTRIEEGLKEMKSKREEEKMRYEMQLSELKSSLKEEREKNQVLSKRLTESNAVVSHKNQLLAAMTEKCGALSNEHSEAKETIASLRQRLVTIESTAELASSAAAQKYREASYDMQNELHDLQEQYEACITELKDEKEGRKNAEEELADLKEFCEEMEAAQRETEVALSGENSTLARMTSPISMNSEASKKSTASTVLAKTLKVELERGHNATERIIESEKIIAVTQSKLRETEKDLNFAKKEISSLRHKLEKCEKKKNVNNIDSEYFYDSSASTKNASNNEVSKKLSEVRTECNEYKRELDSIITQIRGIESDDVSTCGEASVLSKSKAKSNNLMRTVKDLAQVCTRVNVAAGDRVGELEGRIRFLTQSMYQMNEICSEDQSHISGVSMSLQMMEEGSTTPVKDRKTPMKFLYLDANDNSLSPVGTDSPFVPPREKTPLKITRLKDELCEAEKQLQTVRDEKVSLESALSEAKEQIEYLSSSAQEAISSASVNNELLNEKSKLEKSVLGLRSHIQELEGRIESLEDDKAYLFDDAEARVEELEEAKSKIEFMQKEAHDISNLRTSEVQAKLTAAEGQIKSLAVDLDSKIMSLREIEASRARLHEELQMITDENDDNIEMIHHLQETLSETTQEANELKASFMRCNEELAQTIEDNHALQLMNNELQCTVNEHQEELETKSTGLESLSKEYDIVKEKLSVAEDAYDSLHEELVRMGSKMELLTQINDEYEAELTAANDARNNIQKQLKCYDSNNKSLTNDLAATKKALEEANFESKNTKSCLEQFEEKFTQHQEETIQRNAKMEKEIKSKNEELKLLEARCSVLQASFTEKGERETEILREHAAQLELIQIELKEKVQIIVTKDEELKSLRAHFDEVEASLVERSKELQLLGSHANKVEANLIEGKRRESEMLRDHEIELGRLNMEIHEKNQDLAKLSENQNSVGDATVSLCEIGFKEDEIIKLRRKNESLDRKCKRMREYVKNLTSKCKEWEETYAEKDNASHSFQRKYEDAMSKISELTAQMNICNNSMSMSIGSSKGMHSESSVVSQLRHDLGRKDKKINTLKRRLLERSSRDSDLASNS